MNQGLKLKTILIISIAIFGAGFLFVSPANATGLPLTVEWSETGSTWLPLSGPIFSETNFLPGQDVIRLIRVTNNSGQTQRIATEAINESDPDNFASQLNLTIKEGPTIIYNNTLTNFFNQGETYLSSLANGAQTQYDFTIAFNSGSGNEYQEKALSFDILVGFEGTEGGLPLPPPGGGTGGGLPPGLTILDESVRITEIEETSVTIIWTTSYFSTSQIIYGAEGESHTLNLADNSGTPPKYGYTHTTPEYDISPKVTAHSVTITGLTSGTTYYFRAVSHASLAISRELSFTTIEPKEEIKISEEKFAEETESSEIIGKTTEGKNKISGGALSSAPSQGIGETGEPEKFTVSNQFSSQEETSEPKQGFGSLLASIGTFLKRISSSTLLIIILILVLIILALVVVKKIRKNFEKKKNKGY